VEKWRGRNVEKEQALLEILKPVLEKATGLECSYHSQHLVFCHEVKANIVYETGMGYSHRPLLVRGLQVCFNHWRSRQTRTYAIDFEKGTLKSLKKAATFIKKSVESVKSANKAKGYRTNAIRESIERVTEMLTDAGYSGIRESSSYSEDVNLTVTHGASTFVIRIEPTLIEVLRPVKIYTKEPHLVATLEVIDALVAAADGKE